MDRVRGVITDDVVKTVDRVIEHVGKDITFAMTLALGKPVMFINELYKRAKEDPEIKLKILTALALERPVGTNELEKRFINPLAERLFGNSPQFDYMLDFRAGRLPGNVEIYEFFNKAGGYLNNHQAQQNHMSSNYTHVVRDAFNMGVNVFGQLVGCREIDGKLMLSMGCNTDICVQANGLVDSIRATGMKGAIIAEANEKMPFMYGDAVYPVEAFDVVLKGPQYNYELFAPPKDPVMMRDHIIGLQVSTLIRDGGTLQVGIGALGDAIVAGLDLRHSNNALYQEILENSGILERYGALINKIGGTGAFEQGLYGSSEMFVDAFMQLYKRGILKRKVFDNIPLMQLINEGKLAADNIPENILELLHDKKGIHSRLRQTDFNMLTKFGILKEGLSYKDGIIFDGDAKYSTDLNVPEKLAQVKKLLGKEMKNGQVILGAFFIGPKAFYEELNSMSEEERSQFGMSGVEKVNQLYGDEVLRSLQRKDGRFINSGMIANVFGAIASDQLEDGRVISGIGGQYNFVAMAHALPDARLIMLIRSTRGVGKKLRSNVVFSYGHCSVPKHLRDIVVSEYGIADIKGKPDKEVIAAMINIADSRFQAKLLKQAKKAGKLPQSYEIPAEYRNNYPEKIVEFVTRYQAKGIFKFFPFGTDLTDQEFDLGASLKMLKVLKETKPLKATGKVLAEFLKPVPEKAIPYLKRMELDKTSGIGEKLLQKTVVVALKHGNRI
ncbi:MAG TPA: acetyl-CoA hydrolase/transferase C-terminal domain-containing protein [Spirochaetota bacterium]|nr:acetyl-CoA hydrolase/transferase C-terminal domain-containing protein [Spirochaetota bacterium]